jgi:acyl-CoA reductase-like NAD-dependent aldehyde dehydrogenase
VVLKGTELAPRSMWAIVSVFQEAGLPKGALNLISSEPAYAPQVAKALISNPHIKKVNFTGSTMVGKIIGKLASEFLKPVVQELGGKASAIVWEDADLDLAAKQCALGSFINSGQVCMCTERIIVHKEVATEFRKRLIANVDAIFGAKDGGLVLINEGAKRKNKQLVQDAVQKGAVALYGSVDDINAQEASCTRMRPVILDKVTRDMDIYYSESFGPSVSLFEVTTQAEALELANDTEYGLTAAVFTKDLQKGLDFARRIESGAVHINSMTIHDESALPHGGVKASGYGRFNASYGLEEWVRTKTITFPNQRPYS